MCALYVYKGATSTYESRDMRDSKMRKKRSITLPRLGVKPTIAAFTRSQCGGKPSGLKSPSLKKKKGRKKGTVPGQSSS